MMKIKEVTDKILAYHPKVSEDHPHPCDGFKCGNDEDECTGIITSVAPSVDVIRKTAELGANLLIVHEPAFYTQLWEEVYQWKE